MTLRDDGKSVTELEGVILGIVEGREPCSAYAVRLRFARSPTWGWSASQGAIYPAIERLVARKLLSRHAAASGSRKADQLRLTPDGRAELRQWMRSISPGMGGAPVDPIRARVNYLPALAPADVLAFFAEALAAAEDALRRTVEAEPDAAARGQWALRESLLGARLQIEAKIRWLVEARERFRAEKDGVERS